MSLVAIITDTHYGIRGGSVDFHDKTKLFLDKIFFKYLKDNNISNWSTSKI